jgi:5-methylcytosine-specific restriction enzyme B
MKLADRIRYYVIKEYIQPARGHAKAVVDIRAGDIHKELALHNRMPSVCEALDTEKFKELARVQLIERSDPQNGATVCWTFRLIR